MKPKLRFKEFTDEWIEYVLQSESDVRDGTHDSPKYVEKGYPLITSKNLTDMGTLDFSNVSYLKQDDFDKINQRSKVDIGDILFGMIGTIGKPVRIDRDDFAIKNVALIKEKGLIKNDYLIHYLHTPSINKQFANNQDGGTQKFIALDKIRKLKIKMPSRKEQEKIVSLFNLLDKKIELQSKKVEDLKLFKKGLDKIIFSNTDLFEEDMIKNRFLTDGGTALEEYISNKGTHKIISIGNYSTTGTYIDNGQKIILNDKTKTKLLDKNDLVMILNDKTTTGDIIGSSILIDENNKYIYNQRSQRLICKEINPKYAWCYLNNYIFRKRVFKLAQGGTQIYVNFSTIENQKILIPKNEKIEIMIVESIIGIKNKTDKEIKKLNGLIELKKGLVQNMFV